MGKSAKWGIVITLLGILLFIVRGATGLYASLAGVSPTWWLTAFLAVVCFYLLVAGINVLSNELEELTLAYYLAFGALVYPVAAHFAAYAFGHFDWPALARLAHRSRFWLPIVVLTVWWALLPLTKFGYRHYRRWQFNREIENYSIPG